MQKAPRLITLLLVAALGASSYAPAKEGPYTADWESLAKHRQAPEWLADAKLGIYFHWGVYSVPAFSNEWYPRRMHLKNNERGVYEHHRQKYGDPADYPYHKFVPQFKAEHFDAAEWAGLFEDAGARFAGPVAQHHDGFAMWASKVNPWNAGDRGPKKDITGLLAAELRKRDMKLITTFHHARLLQRNADNPERWGGFNSHYPYNPDWATSSTDPLLSKLYGNMPADEFHKYWFDQVKEVVEAYDPEMIWFDSWLNLIPEKDRQELAAYYFNRAAEKGQEVAIGYKQTDYPASVGVLDIEQGGKKDLSESVWMTDVTISNSSWCYVEGQTYKPADLVVRNMIDVWSKNGVVLLNVSPKADGTIPEEQKTTLRGIGEWLRAHGEAVYNTRPFSIYGFGSAKVADGHFGGQSATVKYSASDLRFTVAKDGRAMYLLFLGKPKAGETVSLRLLASHRYPPRSKVRRVTVLGSGAEVEYGKENGNPYLVIPDGPLNEIATVFKFELE